LPSLSKFIFKIFNAFGRAEIFFSAVFSDNKEASGVFVLGMHINYKVFQMFQLFFSFFMMLEQFFKHCVIRFFNFLIIGWFTDDAFEDVFYCTNVLIMFICEDDVLSFLLVLLFLDFFILLFNLFFSSISYCFIMITMIIPEGFQVTTFSDFYLQCFFSNFDSFFNNLIDCGLI